MDQTPPGADDKLLAAYREEAPHERRAAADRLFSRYYERVGRWCQRFTGDRESAADLAQEVFLKAYRHLDSFQGDSQFGTWLYSIARNESINRSKRSGPPATESEEALIQVPALEPDPEALAAQSSSSRQLHRFLTATLDETERTVFTLHYGDDLPLDAITRLLRLDNSSGAKAYIVSAKRKLARAVAKLSMRGERL
ncbi:MAG TPA: sigma-70 family RNA polymerase sigma factor [Thermoanaerobaculia bacterium]|jgi:RNA polymerase sigma-70 factor (ECF subfamily)|nr:sigma-70 family RNA polymerase sigma factor [Thermoanaerobaculia bacterium]